MRDSAHMKNLVGGKRAAIREVVVRIARARQLGGEVFRLFQILS